MSEVQREILLPMNQPLSTVTNNAYKEKMAEFDPAFSMQWIFGLVGPSTVI